MNNLETKRKGNQRTIMPAPLQFKHAKGAIYTIQEHRGSKSSGSRTIEIREHRA